MSNIDKEIKSIANRLSSNIVRLQSAHRELDRIGRVFRDVWTAEITALLTKAATNPTDLTNEEAASINDYRGSGRTAMQWAEFGTDLYRLHVIMEENAPESDDQNPSVTTGDIAVSSTYWLSGGNASEEPLNVDIYNLALTLSRLVYDLEYDIEIYEAKVKTYIEGLVNDTDEDGYTGRTKELWVDTMVALLEIVKVMFGELSTNANGQGKYINAF